MSNDETNNTTQEQEPTQDGLDAATEWANAFRGDGPHVLGNPRIGLRQGFNHQSDGDGFIVQGVELPHDAGPVRMRPGMPLVSLIHSIQWNGAGSVEDPYEGLDIHPRLVRKGEEAVRESLANSIQNMREEAARKLQRAAELSALLEEEWGTAWPAYWREDANGSLKGVKE